MSLPPPSSSRSPIGLIGLGLMGTALAHRLLEAGFPLRVWNRTPAKAEPLIQAGAVWSDHPLAGCRRVLLSLFTSGTVADVLAAMDRDLQSGSILIDTTTGDPAEVAVLARRLAERGVTYLDAPISGSSAQTRRGEATVLVGGDSAAFEACRDLWPVLGARVRHCGPSGSASRLKLVTNLVLGLNRAALAEGLAFAESQGVSPATALEVLADSMAYSRAIDAKGSKMVMRDFTPQARLSQHLKDLRLLLDAAAAAGQELPLAEAHRRLLERGEARGLGDLDNSAILEVLRPRPGTPTPNPP